MKEAEQKYMWALQGKEKALGREHTLTLSTINNLGIETADQGKMKEAEQIYVWALQRYEKSMGLEVGSSKIANDRL